MSGAARVGVDDAHRPTTRDIESTVLGCSDLRVEFGSVVALDSVSLRWADRGKIHAVVGQNGAGKTTLCRVIAGMTRATQGTVEVDGVSYPAGDTQRVRRAGVELVHQTFALPPHFTVAEALQLFQPAQARGGLYRKRKIEQLWAGRLEEFGFHVLPTSWVRDLSPEQRQAVEITRALSSGSRIIVLDEPTAVLPPEAIAGLFDRLRELVMHGITFLVVMHKLRQVRAVADTVAVLAGGHVVLHPTSMAAITDEEIARLIMDVQSSESVTSASAVAMGLGAGVDDPGQVHVDVASVDALHGTGKADVPVPPGATISQASALPATVEGLETDGHTGDVAHGTTIKRLEPSERRHFALQVEEVSTPSSEGRHGLQAFSVTVRVGETVGIAGVEGNGQQALVDTVVGLLPYRSGRILLSEVDVGNLRISARRRIGLRYIPADRQSRAVSLSNSLWVNAMAAQVSSGYGTSGAVRRGYLSERKLRRKGEDRLRQWQVRYSSRDQAMRELSGGNLQRVVLAREVDDNASLIVAEQPTQGLDLGGTELVWAALRRAASAGAGILLVSSDLDELFALSDRIVVALDGEAVEELYPPYDREVLGRAMVAGVTSS
ncbi:MAG: ATP-binding cassette domain-containing protein [Actinobacteria bacterium]|nr:ATP-binding cassette domain-containing protein [Actinomycetota bacterium]